MKTFVHVKQPNDYTCAPAVVAMITGDPLNVVTTALRTTSKGTKHAHMIRYLQSRGVPCSRRFVSMRGKTLPLVAIVRIKFPDKRFHVVVKQDRTWFDPLLNTSFTGMPPVYSNTKSANWANGGRITSFLWIGLL